MVPSPEQPLTGHCACGEVRFTVSAPFHSARYCHCHHCRHIYSQPDGADHVFVRMGALDADPGIRLEYRQWVSSAVPWETIPDDGLPRYEGAAP